jgi:hypothetical protein
MIRLERVTERFRRTAGERVALDAVDLTVAAMLRSYAVKDFIAQRYDGAVSPAA